MNGETIACGKEQSKSEVRRTSKRMKSGKDVGPDDFPDIQGELAGEMLTRSVVREGLRYAGENCLVFLYILIMS